MSKTTNNLNLRNNFKNDLRKQNSIVDKFIFQNYSIQACMVILFVVGLLLFSIISIATTPNPNIVLRL
jgi:hypothetical protein